MSPDTARSVAFDPAAPPDERTDALAELQQSHMPSNVLTPETLVRIFEMAEYSPMNKAIDKNVVPFPGRFQGKPGMQSVGLDEWQLGLQGEYWEKPAAVNFEALRHMVDQTPVLSAVVMTRIRQVQRFCRVQESSQGLGFVIRHADREHQITPDEKESIALLQRFFTNCGWEFNPRERKKLRRDSFGQLMSKLVRDSLVLDSCPIETEFKRDRKKGLDGFYAVDGSTIRLTPDDGYRGNEDIFALQVVQGRIRTAYTHDDLIYEARNPRSDVFVGGYGLSETELLVRVVTGFLNAMTLNIKGFSENSIPKGVLHLSGNYTQDDLVSFRRYWNSMVKGVNSAWTVPVLVSKDQESKASFENFGINFDEMMFAKWMTFLTSIICAVYGMSPSEISFDSFTGGNTSALSGSDTEEKLADSKDKGLRPLLSYFENIFTDFIVSDFSDKYVFRWAGLDEEDLKQRDERAKLVLTVNEMRAEEGYDALDGPLGDAPLNPSLIGVWQQLQQAQQPQDFGQPGADDGQGDAGGEDPQGEQGGEGAEGQGPDFGQAPGADLGQAAGGDAPDFGEDPGPDFGQLQKANSNHDARGRFAPGRAPQVRLEKRKLHDLYDLALAHPLAPPDALLVNLSPEALALQIDKGPAVETEDGRIVVTGKRLSREHGGSTKGWGMVKILWRHGQKSDEPDGYKVTRGDVLALPEVVRSVPTAIALDTEDVPVRWEWQRKRFDGKTVVYAASRFGSGDGHNHVVSIYVENPERMMKSDPVPGGELFAPMPRIPAEDLSIVLSAARSLTAHYRQDEGEVKRPQAVYRLGDAW